MPQLKQNDDSSMGIEGSAGGKGGFVPVTMRYDANSVDAPFFTADRPYVVHAIRGRVEVSGTGGACTATIRKVPSGTALGSGTALHSGSFNLEGTAATNQTLTLSTTASTVKLAAGDSLAFDITGTATSALGSITVTLSPA